MLKNKNIIQIISLSTALYCASSFMVFAMEAPTESTSGQEKIVAAPTTEDKKDDDIGFSGDYLTSRFSRNNGDIATAAESLNKVYQQDTENKEIANQLIGLYLLEGKIDSAIEIANGIYKKDNKEQIAVLMLTLQAIKHGNISEADKILDNLADSDDGQIWFPLISAWLDVEQKKLKKPLTLEELSAEVGNAAPIVNYHLALINAQAGFTQAAANNFKQAILDAAHPPSRVMNMLLQFAEKNHSPEALKPIIAKYNASHPKTTQEKIPFINNVQSGTAEVLFTLGTIMLSGDSLQEATLYLQLALYVQPDMPIATIALAQTYSELQQYNISNEILERVEPKNPLYSSAQLSYAINLGRMKKTDEAVKKLDELIAKTPFDIEIYMAKGDMLRMQEKYADAISVYNSAIAKDKNSDKNWPIFFAISTCYDKLGNWQETEKNLQKAIAISPDQPDTLNYYGYSLLTRGEKISEAKNMIEKAIKKRPSDPQIVDSMGWALYLLGDYDKSVQYLEIAVSMLPADSTVNEHLGDVYWRLGRVTEAKFQWERAITYSSDENTNREINKKIIEGLPKIAEKPSEPESKNETKAELKTEASTISSQTKTE